MLSTRAISARRRRPDSIDLNARDARATCSFLPEEKWCVLERKSRRLSSYGKQGQHETRFMTGMWRTGFSDSWRNSTDVASARSSYTPSHLQKPQEGQSVQWFGCQSRWRCHCQVLDDIKQTSACAVGRLLHPRQLPVTPWVPFSSFIINYHHRPTEWCIDKGPCSLAIRVTHSKKKRNTQQT